MRNTREDDAGENSAATTTRGGSNTTDQRQHAPTAQPFTFELFVPVSLSHQGPLGAGMPLGSDATSAASAAAAGNRTRRRHSLPSSYTFADVVGGGGDHFYHTTLGGGPHDDDELSWTVISPTTTTKRRHSNTDSSGGNVSVTAAALSGSVNVGMSSTFATAATTSTAAAATTTTSEVPHLLSTTQLTSPLSTHSGAPTLAAPPAPTMQQRTSEVSAHLSSSNSAALPSTLLSSSSSLHNSNVFVSSLPHTLQDADLHALFAPFGAIESAKVMLNIHTGKSRGIAFVKYFDTEDAKRAIDAMDGRVVDGIQLDVRFASTKSVFRPPAPTCKVFLCNVPSAVSFDRLQSHLAKFGEVTEIKIRVDTPTTPTTTTTTTAATVFSGERRHQSADDAPSQKRIVYVTFKNQADAEAAAQVLHLSYPFEECGEVPLLAKLAETVSRRKERLAARGVSSSHANDTSTSTAAVDMMSMNSSSVSFSSVRPPQVMIPPPHADPSQSISLASAATHDFLFAAAGGIHAHAQPQPHGSTSHLQSFQQQLFEGGSARGTSVGMSPNMFVNPTSFLAAAVVPSAPPHPSMQQQQQIVSAALRPNQPSSTTPSIGMVGTASGPASLTHHRAQEQYQQEGLSSSYVVQYPSRDLPLFPFAAASSAALSEQQTAPSQLAWNHSLTPVMGQTQDGVRRINVPMPLQPSRHHHHHQYGHRHHHYLPEDQRQPTPFQHPAAMHDQSQQRYPLPFTVQSLAPRSSAHATLINSEVADAHLVMATPLDHNHVAGQRRFVDPAATATLRYPLQHTAVAPTATAVTHFSRDEMLGHPFVVHGTHDSLPQQPFSVHDSIHSQTFHAPMTLGQQLPTLTQQPVSFSSSASLPPFARPQHHHDSAATTAIMPAPYLVDAQPQHPQHHQLQQHQQHQQPILSIPFQHHSSHHHHHHIRRFFQ